MLLNGRQFSVSTSAASVLTKPATYFLISYIIPWFSQFPPFFTSYFLPSLCLVFFSVNKRKGSLLPSSCFSDLLRKGISTVVLAPSFTMDAFNLRLPSPAQSSECVDLAASWVIHSFVHQEPREPQVQDQICPLPI